MPTIKFGLGTKILAPDCGMGIAGLGEICRNPESGEWIDCTEPGKYFVQVECLDVGDEGTLYRLPLDKIEVIVPRTEGDSFRDEQQERVLRQARRIAELRRTLASEREVLNDYIDAEYAESDGLDCGPD